MSSTGLQEALSLSDVRRHHLAVVLGRLRRHGPRSRADLARETGLAKATVSTLVADLMARDLVAEIAGQSGSVGRPATLVAATGMSVVTLGMQIEVDHVSACAADLTGRVVRSERRYGDNRACSPDAVLGRLAEVTASVLDAVAGRDVEVVGACVAVPGLVERVSGEILVAPNLAWSRLELSGLSGVLGLLPGIDVVVENEANLGALAELERWDQGGPASFVYVSGGVGVGAGIVVDGHLIARRARLRRRDRPPCRRAGGAPVCLWCPRLSGDDRGCRTRGLDHGPSPGAEPSPHGCRPPSRPRGRHLGRYVLRRREAGGARG